MRSGSTSLRTARLVAAILLGGLLVPGVGMRGSQATAITHPGILWPVREDMRGQPEATAAAWTRTLDPALLFGSQFPLFDGVALDDLFVYAYVGGVWTQVPFQFDEVDASGAYVAFEDGLLDANDELAFMSADLGSTAALYEWIDDADSTAYPRFEVQVTDPLNPADMGWVYVYRSSTLSPAFSPYVTWDAVNNRTVAGAYVAGYTPASHYGLDSLELNGTGVDLLDRAKLRVSGVCVRNGNDFPFSQTEDIIKNLPVTPTIQGPVRLGGGTLSSSSWAYGSLFQTLVEFDAGYVEPRCDTMVYDLVRVSSDWLNPAGSGMAPMTYFDSNTPAGVPVDGSPEAIPATPVAGWLQVSGGLGSLVQVAEIDPGGAAVTNYYKDNQSLDPGDTGDNRSFGDAGYLFTSPTGVVKLLLTAYVLDPNQPNVGEVYRQYQANPLQATATAQSCSCEPFGAAFGWLPLPVYPDVETTFSATVNWGRQPLTYDWIFGDDGSIAAGIAVTHTFTITGTFPVTLTVSNEWGAAAPVVHTIRVWGAAPSHFVYLPAIIRLAP